MSMIRAWIPFLLVGPARIRCFIVDMMPFQNIRKMRDIVDTMDRTARDVFYAKKRALQRGDESVVLQVGEGKDIMSVLCERGSLPSELSY
jgi:hypothetical protein